MIYGVIMAGGKGERFWPLSSRSRPKQLIPITDNRSMLQMTIDRVSAFIPSERTIIVAGENIKDAILEKTENVKRENVLAEPTGRNTCLAIGYVAVHLQKRDPKAIMVVFSADHIIEPVSRMVDVLKVGTHVAEDSKLVTVGIVPTRAETGYGYIELSDDQWLIEGVTVCKVSGFKEKPRPTVAQQYYYDRKHLWNSGMFIWSVRAILEALEGHQPEMYGQLMEYSKFIDSADEKNARVKLYKEAESISIDYAVLEDAENVLTLKGDFLWDDVGSWLSLQRFKRTDRENNVVVGSAVLLDCFETTVYEADDGLIAALGVSDLVIAKSGKVTFVGHKSQLNRIKELLAKISLDKNLEKYL